MSDRQVRYLDGPDDDPYPYTPMCKVCRHLRSIQGWTCDAFPHGIPDKILDEKHDHRTPYPGDHGIRFAPVDFDDAT